MFNYGIFKTYKDDGYGAALIAGSSQLAATAIGAAAQNNLNSTTRSWDEKMYAQQRKDALSDRDAANTYNSPQSQMARFQAAGLNPNLVYGQPAQSSQPVRSSSVPQWSPKAPDYSGIAQGMGNAMSVKLQQSQLNNMAQQTQLLMSQQKNVDADTSNKISQNPGYAISQTGNTLDNQLKAATMAINVALAADSETQARENLNQTLANTQFTLDKNDREAAANKTDIASKLQAIIESRSRINVNDQSILNAKSALQGQDIQNQINTIMLNMRKNGINPNASIENQLLGYFLEKLGLNPTTNSQGKIENPVDQAHSNMQSLMQP